MKDKLIDTLGAFGGIIFFLISLVSYVIPVLVITESFWLGLVLFLIMYIFPVSEIVFWVWSLIIVFNGPQDIFAIIYYVLFAITFLPVFISSVLELFRK